MGSAKRELIMGVWGLCLGAGTKPLVRGSGAKPPKAERNFIING